MSAARSKISRLLAWASAGRISNTGGPLRVLQVQRVQDGIAHVQQLLTLGFEGDDHVARRVTGRGNRADAGQQLPVERQRVEPVCDRGEGVADPVGVHLRALGQVLIPVPVGRLDRPDEVAGVGEDGVASRVEYAADVVGVGMGDDDRVDGLGRDAGGT